MSDHSTFLLPEQKVFGAAAAQRRDLNEANEPLLPETEFTGVVPTAADRKITDKPFALALAAATIFWLISGFCSVGSADMTWLTQLSSASQSYAPEYSVSKIMSVFLGLVVFSVSAACGCGFAWIRVVQLYPLKVVSLSFFANIALWLGVCITALSIGSIYLAVFGVFMGALYVYLYMVSANAIERTAALLQYASRVTNSQPGLIRLMFMGALGVAIVSALSSWFSVAAYSSGSVVECSGEADCDQQDGWFGIHGASKAFKPSMWSFFVMIFNVVVFYSLVHFLLLAQLFVTTYVTSVWYFHATEENRCSSAIDNGVEAAQLQSGTIAVAAFVRAVVETLVYFCERALKLSRKGQQSEQSCLRGTCECLVKVFLRCGFTCYLCLGLSSNYHASFPFAVSLDTLRTSLHATAPCQLRSLGRHLCLRIVSHGKFWNRTAGSCSLLTHWLLLRAAVAPLSSDF